MRCPTAFLPLQVEDAAQVPVQDDAGHKRGGVVWICSSGDKREAHAHAEEQVKVTSSHRSGASASVATVEDAGQTAAPPLPTPAPASGLHD